MSWQTATVASVPNEGDLPLGTCLTVLSGPDRPCAATAGKRGPGVLAPMTCRPPWPVRARDWGCQAIEYSYLFKGAFPFKSAPIHLLLSWAEEVAAVGALNL